MPFQGTGYSALSIKNVALWAFNTTLSKVQVLTSNASNELIVATAFPDSGGTGRSINSTLLSNAGSATLPITNYALDTVACVYGWDAAAAVMKRATLAATSTDVDVNRPALVTYGINMIFDSDTGVSLPWSGRSAPTDAMGVGDIAAQTLSIGQLFNGANFDLWRGQANNTETLAAEALGIAAVNSYGWAWDGANFQRLYTGSAANIAAATQITLAVSLPGEWTLTHAPAADTVATASKAAGAAGVRHVLTSVCADLTAVAAITAPLTLVVRDGATGVGAILWQRRLTSPAGETKSVEVSGLNIVGSPATAMTVEFTAAPGATNFETISATGHSKA